MLLFQHGVVIDLPFTWMVDGSALDVMGYYPGLMGAIPNPLAGVLLLMAQLLRAINGCTFSTQTCLIAEIEMQWGRN